MPLVPLNDQDRDFCLVRMRPYIKEIMRANPNRLFVAGGFIRSVITHDEIKDIDLFCPTRENAQAFAQHVRRASGNSLHESPNAYTVRTRPYTTQFIHRWTFETPQQCIESFDFTIAKAAIWHDGAGWKGVCDDRFYPDLAAKRLVYCSPIRDEEAGGSMLRVLKFYQRGFRIPMDSLGAVIARIAASAGDAIVDGESNLAPIITGLLREVDPVVDPDHDAHLPSSDGQQATTINQTTILSPGTWIFDDNGNAIRREPMF